MTSQDRGRNQIRFNNSDGQCLLENWVEERAVKHIDDEEVDTKSKTKKIGHKGILCVEFDAQLENLTTVRESYKKPQQIATGSQGRRRQLLIQNLMEKITAEVENEEMADPEPEDPLSVTHRDYGGDYVSLRRQEDEEIVPDGEVGDYFQGQPMTFWTENHNGVTGVSRVAAKDTVFRKNTAFSKPIGEYWDQTQPYTIENVPKM